MLKEKKFKADMEAKQAMVEGVDAVVPVKKARVGPKAPNSLSCMKKKKVVAVAAVNGILEGEGKRKRKRTKKVTEEVEKIDGEEKSC